MKTKFKFFRVLQKGGKERGASLVEYGLLIALIAVIGIPAVTAVGTQVALTFANHELECAYVGSGNFTSSGGLCF